MELNFTDYFNVKMVVIKVTSNEVLCKIPHYLNRRNQLCKN